MVTVSVELKRRVQLTPPTGNRHRFPLTRLCFHSLSFQVALPSVSDHQTHPSLSQKKKEKRKKKYISLFLNSEACKWKLEFIDPTEAYCCVYIYIIKSGVSTQNSIPLSFQINSISTLKFLSLLLSLSLWFRTLSFLWLVFIYCLLVSRTIEFPAVSNRRRFQYRNRQGNRFLNLSLSLTLWFWTPLPFPCHVFVFWFFERSIYFWVLFGLNFKKKLEFRFVSCFSRFSELETESDADSFRWLFFYFLVRYFLFPYAVVRLNSLSFIVLNDLSWEWVRVWVLK